MNKLFLLLPLLTACSFFPSAPSDLLSSENNYNFDMEEMARRYPYWNTGLGAFIAAPDTLNPEITSPSQELLAQYQTITVQDKRLMLQKMDLIRFIVNTPEFESNFMKAVFWGDADMSGPGGTLKLNEPLDNKRYLEIIRRRNYNVSIRKGMISMSAAAVGVVGPKLYVLADSDPQISNAYWIAFPNRDIWSQGGYVQDPYMAGIVFHEMLHNTGFGHSTKANDPVYGAQRVLTSTYNSPGFQAKYAKALSAFRGFYEKRYPSLLAANTVPVATLRARSAGPQPLASPGETVCILNEDGTHTIAHF